MNVMDANASVAQRGWYQSGERDWNARPCQREQLTRKGACTKEL